MSDVALMECSGERGDAVFTVSPSSYYPEEKFVYEDLDVVRNYINLAFGDVSARNVSAQDVSAKDGSVKEGSVKEGPAGGVSATCSTPWLLLQ